MKLCRKGWLARIAVLYRNNYIKIWATKELLLEKARINVEDDNE